MLANGSVCGQERSLTGSVAGGWSYGRAKSILDESRRNPFGLVRLDHSNYLLDPRFLTFHVQPRSSKGFEDFYLGQPQGSGVGFDTAFLPESPWPVRFHYEWVRRLSLTSGLGTADSRSRTESANSRLGLSANYSVPGRPNFGFEFDRIAGTTEPEKALLQGFETHGRAFSLYGRDFRKGWNLDGNLRRQRYRDLVASPADAGALRETQTGMNERERNLVGAVA